MQTDSRLSGSSAALAEATLPRTLRPARDGLSSEPMSWPMLGDYWQEPPAGRKHWLQRANEQLPTPSKMMSYVLPRRAKSSVA
jgi:hypothetical protein